MKKRIIKWTVFGLHGGKRIEGTFDAPDYWDDDDISSIVREKVFEVAGYSWYEEGEG